MKPKNSTVFLYLRIAVAGIFVLAAAALAITATKVSAPLQQAEKRAYTPKKAEADFFKPGRSAEAKPVAESKSPSSSPEIEAYLRRAYPADEISMDQTITGQSGWASLNAGAHSAGSWQLIGPSKATYPAVLDPFLFDGAQYVASGRVSAMAIAPNCTKQNCTLYVGAAGGGIWKTTKALNGSNWQFISGSFASNNIGSILIDPTDPSGNTVYAGTGEPNASGDSGAGMGLYKSTNGGVTWALLPAAIGPITTFSPGTGSNGSYTGNAFLGRGISSIVVDPTNPSHLYVSSGRGVRGVSSVTSGASTNPAVPRPPFGLFESTNGGATFSFIWDGGDGCPATCNGTNPKATIRGVNKLQLDPYWNGTTNKILYGGAFGPTGSTTSGGVWRSTDGGSTWTQIKSSLVPNENTDRAEFAVTPIAGGFTRMYVGEGSTGAPGPANGFNPLAMAARFYRTNDAAGAAVFTDMTTPQNIDYCTAQCWYDNVVYSPGGSPDVAYVGGSFSYGQLHGRSNGRAWLLTSDAGATWSDLTQDGDPNHAEGIHPDSHAIVAVPGNPLQFISGGDGGVVGSDGKYADVSSKCDSRGLNPADTAFCKSLLNRVPNKLLNMNDGLSTLQFQSFSISAQRPKNLLQGGTQDNGTFQYNGSAVVWPQIIYGDGGQSGFNVSNDKLRFNTFTGQANDVNFRDGDPTKWVIATGDIVSSAEASYFYPPIIADPNPSKAGTIFQGSFSVWRTTDWAGNQAFLEANCPEFTTSAADPNCGDFVPLGGPADGSFVDSGDLIGFFYGGERVGGAVAWLARAPQNTFTMWAATGAGRVFISDNVDATPALSVLWNRVDPFPGHVNTPSRSISQIYVDPTNNHHAWIGYLGYNTNTPAQPGHVFDVTWSGVGAAVWTNISYNLPDFPITALVSDDKTGDLYAASDFGVMKLPFGTTTWVVAGNGLPAVECPGLTINSAARVLYVATHGRSGWTMALP